jgi:hypothetical protein
MRHATGVILSLLLMISAVFPALSQIRSARSKVVPLENIEAPRLTSGWRRFLPGLKPDADRTFRPSTPHLALPVNTTALLGDLYWMGSTTRQSYNEGKIGRTYYWDVQGNLRGSTLFIDIAGKGKRGLKLAFARHRSLF